MRRTHNEAFNSDAQHTSNSATINPLLVRAKEALTQRIHNNIQSQGGIVTPESYKTAYLQMMNFHVSQLPLAPQEPPKPRFKSLQLPF